MGRVRKTENITQRSITDYFCERKKATKSKEKSYVGVIPKKVSKLDLNPDLKKKDKNKSSKLLVKALKNQTNLRVSFGEAFPKENKSSNNLKLAEQNKNEFNSKEKSSKSSFKDVPVLLKPKNKKELKEVLLNEAPELENNIRTSVSKRLKKDEVSEKKISKIVTLRNNVEEIKSTTFQFSETTEQPLPESYKFLLQVFTRIDSAAMMLYNRDIIITHKKLQPSLGNMTNLNIINCLSQINTIYPDAFSYERKEIKVLDSLRSRFDIILKPNFKINKLSFNEPEKSVLLLRRSIFYNLLLERVKEEHDNFLRVTSKSRSLIGKVQIDCWHPNFDLENCKPIEMSNLPVFRINKVKSAKEVLGKVMDCLKTEKNVKTSSQAVKHVPNQMEKNDNQNYNRRLPTIAKIVYRIFSSERKNIMTLQLLMEKLQFSIDDKLKDTDLENDVRSLCKIPDWISIFNSVKGDRVRINKKIPLQTILKILETSTV